MVSGKNRFDHIYHERKATAISLQIHSFERRKRFGGFIPTYGGFLESSKVGWKRSALAPLIPAYCFCHYFEEDVSMPSEKPVTVFYSYSHEDEALRDELAKHLRLLEREGFIKEWHDRRITLGDEWKNQIDHYLETAELILLLISPDFINSDYCYDIEMRRAIERHKEGTARVVPIILRPVDWTKAPFASLQALPTGGKPITEWPNRDRAFLDVVQGIRRAVEALRSGMNQPSKGVKTSSAGSGTAPTTSTGPVIHGGIKVKKGDVVVGGSKIDQININMPGKKRR